MWGVLTERLLDLEGERHPRLPSAGAPEPASGMSYAAEGRGHFGECAERAQACGRARTC